jgi:hypothetical protein
MTTRTPPDVSIAAAPSPAAGPAATRIAWDKHVPVGQLIAAVTTGKTP